MADIIFINRSSVKWNDTYDSYMVNSVVGGDTIAGAQMTLGSNETLSASSVSVSLVDVIMTAGIAELLASSNTITTSTPSAILTIGVIEVLTSVSDSLVNISAWITMGVATDVAGSLSFTSNIIDTELTIGVVEIVSSTVAYTSVTAGPLLAIGRDELLTSSQTSTAFVTGLLDLGVTELLASSSSNASTTDAWLQIGILEPLSSTATCVVNETDKELTMGEEVELSNGIIIQSNSVSLLDLGVSELLASTGPISSTVSAAVITMGIDEDLSSTINIDSIVSIVNLIKGHVEVLTATIVLVSPVSSPDIVTGIQEATASTGSIVSTILNTELTMGLETLISSSINLESQVSSFLNLGVTEVLEGTINFTSSIREGGQYLDLIIGIQELLASTSVDTSNAIAELTLGSNEPLSHRLNNPEFTSDGVTRLLYNFNSLPIVDESLYNHNASAYPASLSGTPIFGADSLNPEIGSVEVGNINTTLNYGTGNFCIEFWLKDPGIKETGDGYSILDRLKFTGDAGTQGVYDASAYDSEVFLYTKLSNGTLRFSYRSQEFQYWLGAGYDHVYYGASIYVDLPGDTLDENTHIAIFRYDGNIYLSVNGVIHGNSIYDGCPNLSGGTFDIGNKLGTYTNPELSIDSYRISSASRYTPETFEPLNYLKHIESNITSDITLGLAELLASTTANTSDAIADIGFGGFEPLAHTTSDVISNASAVTIVFGVTEVLSASSNITSNSNSTLTLGITELVASTIINTSSASATYIIFGGFEILTSTSLVTTTVSCNTIDFGGFEPLAHTLIPSGYVGDWNDLFQTPDDHFVASIITSVLLKGVDEILTATSDTTTDVQVYINLGQNENMTSTANIVSVVDSAITLGVTEDLTATIGPISTISNSLLTIGIDELLGDVDNALSSSVTASLSFGVAEELSHTLYEFSSGPVDPYVITVASNAVLDLGVDEILALSESSTSSTNASLVIGITEALSSTQSIISTIGSGDLILGVEEELSDECVCWTSISGTLTSGLVEILSSSVASNSVADAELTLGLDTPLSHSITFTPGESLETGKLFIDGESVIQDENATYTITTIGNTAVDTNEYCPKGDSLSSIYFDGDGDELTIPSSSDWDLNKDYFTADLWEKPTFEDSVGTWMAHEDQWSIGIGSDNTLRVQIYDISGVMYSPNNISALVEDAWVHVAIVKNLNVVKIYINGLHTSTINITNGIKNVNTILSIGKDSHGYMDNIRIDDTILWTSDFNVASNENLLYETQSIPEPYIVIDTIAALTLGIDTPISSTQGVISTTSISLLDLGVDVINAGAVFSVSVTSADLIIGQDEILTASVTAQSNISSNISFGQDEPLSASSELVTSFVAPLYLGDTEYMGMSISTQSVTYASLVLGATELLSATSATSQSAIALISFGIVETASVSTSFTSSSAADLTIGHVEELSSTLDSVTLTNDVEMDLGGPVVLIGNTLVQSYAISSTLVFGVSELMASTIISASITDATLVLGIDELMTATGIVTSNPVGWLTMGIVESLSATQEFISTSDAIAILGLDEVLEAGSIIQSLVNGDVGLGTMEMMTSTIGPISTTGVALLDLGVTTIVASTGSIVSNLGSNLTLGAPEDLSFTCVTNIIGETGELFIDGEGIIEDENGNHTITNYGIPSIDPSESVQGESSIYFNGGSYLEIADSEAWNFGDDNLTIDFWIKLENLINPQYIINQYESATERWDISYNPTNGISFNFRTAGSLALQLTTGVSSNTTEWQHIALVRNVNDWSIYKDSVLKDSETLDVTIPNYASPLYIAYRPNYAYKMSGNMDNIRVVNGDALWTSEFDIETDLQYSGISVNTHIAASETIPVLTMGIVEELSSTINFTTESDGSIVTGIIEVLATLGFGIAITSADITMGVDEPLAHTEVGITGQSNVVADLGIPGNLEELSSSISIELYAEATSLDTGVTELVSAFKMIWSQIHTPVITFGVTELFSGSVSVSTVVGTPDMIIGMLEIMSSTSFSVVANIVELSMGIGEYVSSTVNISSTSDALLSTGDDELLASTIITTGAVAGEIIFGLIEMISATRIVNTVTIGQIFAGIEEIQEGTVVCSSNTTALLGLDTCSLVHNRRRSRNGGIFITT
jgi:hypothetical protein